MKNSYQIRGNQLPRTSLSKNNREVAAEDKSEKSYEPDGSTHILKLDCKRNEIHQSCSDDCVTASKAWITELSNGAFPCFSKGNSISSESTFLKIGKEKKNQNTTDSTSTPVSRRRWSSVDNNIDTKGEARGDKEVRQKNMSDNDSDSEQVLSRISDRRHQSQKFLYMIEKERKLLVSEKNNLRNKIGTPERGSSQRNVRSPDSTISSSLSLQNSLSVKTRDDDNVERNKGRRHGPGDSTYSFDSGSCTNSFFA